MPSANPLLYFMQMYVAFLLPVGHDAPICAGHGIFMSPSSAINQHTSPTILNLYQLAFIWEQPVSVTTTHGHDTGQFSLVGKCASSPINAGVNRLWAEGHDGNSTMRSANPLLYFMQMFVAFLLPVGHNAPICAGHGIFMPPSSAINQHTSPTIPNIYQLAFIWEQPVSATTTHGHDTGQFSLVAKWAGSSINAGVNRLWAERHGGNSTMRSANPPLYFMQVSRRYGKCFRSNDPFLIKLPCPQLICLFVIDLVDCAENLLLLSEDVETNPGPGVTQFAKQLQSIADDLREMKEERLTAIESKLANISALDNEIANCETGICALQEVVRKLELQIDDLENRSKKI
ncbi:uncharacterized protein LOC119167701 isoform X1 [Rhipicephalus microplus]|uniref:uncharacterized protein LOC119167701 isoform X1 n=1 Tax=Rhipicephalus microplus TaxID=6941 RepID=UPI003F6C2429